MPNDPKLSAMASPAAHREKGVRIFMYPKIIFLFPTFVMAVVAAIGMNILRPHAAVAGTPAFDTAHAGANLLGVLFLGVFFFNLLILAIDFPRFTVVAGVLFGTTLVFLLAWMAAFFGFNPLSFLAKFFKSLNAEATASFYWVVSFILLVTYGIIYITRYLDYWEIMPNEILHHHGPWSDLERFPTMNLKFDKEIPDIFEHFLLGAGRLVLHVTDERQAIVLDNVLQINSKEDALKKMMSRLEVRVTTDQEVAEN